ncbi:hypothetical protein NFI96_009665, partial [Prochilodus magdalenae]
SVSEMSSGVQSQAVKAAAEGKDKVKEHKAMTDVKPDDGKKSAVQPLMLSPELLSGHGEFACSVCSETFFSLAQLAKHVQFHDQDRPFPCVICGKRFLSRSHHAEHQRVHTRERPFPCNRCERAFTTHHNLKRHQLIHDKEEMYRCTVCGVLFCQEHQLGNIKSIIRVLKQHSVDELIDPQELSELEPLPEQKPALETLPNLKLTTVFKEEQKTSRNRRKHKPLHLEDEQSPFAEREEKPSQLSYHSEGPQILRGKEKEFTDLDIKLVAVWSQGWSPNLHAASGGTLDESRFYLSTCDRRDRLWRLRGECYAVCNIIQHDWFGGGSVMVWGGLSLERRTDLYRLDDGTLTAIRDQDEILGPLVRLYAGAVGPGFLLVQNNARPHVARVCRQFLENEGIDTMDWPTGSPDLNPIEHLWDIMFRSIRRHQVALQTVQELSDALVQIWEEIPQDTIRLYQRFSALGPGEPSPCTSEWAPCSKTRPCYRAVVTEIQQQRGPDRNKTRNADRSALWVVPHMEQTRQQLEGLKLPDVVTGRVSSQHGHLQPQKVRPLLGLFEDGENAVWTWGFPGL